MLSDPRTQRLITQDVAQVHIRVVGVGGAGVNAVKRMGGTPVLGVELLCVNTDAAQLQTVAGVATLAIGPQTTHGLGSGGNPEVGRRAAEESRMELRKRIEGADLVFIASGMGGGTGTGAAPVVARVAKEAGALAVAIVTTPFGFEGGRRQRNADAGLEVLGQIADTMIVVSNERLLTVIQRKTTVRDSFSRADQVMMGAILAVSRIVNVPGDINLDFADLEAVLSRGGMGVVAVGQAAGPQRMLNAVKKAVENPLVERSAHGAKGLMFAITGGPDLTLHELSEAGNYIAGIADPDANITFGVHVDPDRPKSGDVEAILIATRLPPGEQPHEAPSPLSVAEKVKLATAHYYHGGAQTP
jgi:cell division protein FtsZ